MATDVAFADVAAVSRSGPDKAHQSPSRPIKACVSVIPWTVNEPAMMNKLLDMGVDGIISDRPDLVQMELRKRKP